MIGTTYVDAGVKSYSYGNGFTSITDERNNTTTYSFRSYGNPDYQVLTSIASPLQATTIGLNSRDLITSITQGGKSRSYGYDGRYYVTSITEPETGTTTLGRDANGNQTSRQVGSSGTTTYTYDGLDRLTGITYPGGPTIAKTYNGRGRLLSVTGGDASRSMSYDGNDNLTSETLRIGSVSLVATYAYNALDQLTSTTYPKTDRLVEYAPNTLGRPSKVGTFVTGVAYHNSGQVNSITYANGTSSTYGQNSRLWPSTFGTAKSANYISSSYTYDKVGNLTSISDSIDSAYSRTLGYDAINRLTSATGPWGSGTIAYDGRGNITSMGLTGGNITYTYDGTNDRLNSTSGGRTATFSYGNYGEITSDGSNAYTYDQVPNLKSVNSTDAAEKLEYKYDGLNNRVSRTKAGVPTYEFYSSRGQLLLEYTPSAAEKTVEHFYLGNLRVAQVTKDTSVAVQATNTNLTASPASVSCGVNTSLSASIAPSSAVGSVEFYNAGALIGSAAVSNGNANLAYAFSSIGQKAITAKYVPTAGQPFTTSTSTPATTVTVSGSAPAITSTLTSPQPRQGTAMTISIQVAGCGIAGTGNAVLKNAAGATVATSALSATKTASFSITSPTVATNYSVSYTESGLASPLNIAVSVPAGPLVTALLLTASPTVVTHGATVLLKLTGIPAAANVSFTLVGSSSAAATISCVPNQPCVAAVTAPTSTTAAYVANFPATAGYAAASATSNTITPVFGFTVGSIVPELVATLDKANVFKGENIRMTLRVTRPSSVPTNVPQPYGSWQVYDGTSLLATVSGNGVPLTDSIAFLPMNFIGTRQLSVKYFGDANYAEATVSAGTVNVLPLRPSVVEVRKSPSLSIFGQTLTISVGVVLADGSGVVNGGNVGLWVKNGAFVNSADDATAIGVAAVVNGIATFTIPTGNGGHPYFNLAQNPNYAASGMYLKAWYDPAGISSGASAGESTPIPVRMYTEHQRRAIITSIILGDDE
jgi:YD repeat-containing protein